MVKKAGGRVRQLDKKQSKEKAKTDAAKQKAVPTSFQLLDQVYQLFRRNWRVLGGIVLVYVILNVVFASSVFGSLGNAISNARQTHHFSDALNGYGSLLGGASGGVQSVLLIFETLVIIWVVRDLFAGKQVAVKQAYYQSMTPLVPFLLVLLVVVIQLIPMTLGAAVLGAVGAAFSGFATLVAGIIFVALSAWTIYMVSASLFGLYIVTLPNMQPRQALNSSKNLVHFRRWTVLRRLLFLVLFTLLVLGVVIIPLILIVPVIVPEVFFGLTMLAVLFANSYIYSLYKGLLG